jgi:O-antigen/teichoic acid export membrane protein
LKFNLPAIGQFTALLILNITNALFQLMVIPLLVHNTSTVLVGTYFLVLSFGVLASIFINFGTGQTAVVEVRHAHDQPSLFAQIAAQVFSLRFLALCIALLVCFALPFMVNNGWYYLCAIPLLLAECINPQYFLIATYNVRQYSLLNVCMRIAAFIGIYIFRTHEHIVAIALLFSGTSVLILHLKYIQTAFFIKTLLHKLPSFDKTIQLVKAQSLVLGNGLTVHLQQSLFLFALPNFVTPVFLSAYGLIDKLISSGRMMVNAYSAAVMPHAAGTHQQGKEHWEKLKRQQNKILAVLCILAGAIIYFFPEQILIVLLWGKKASNADFFNQATILLKLIAPVPLLIALNVLNVAELLIEKKYIAYFIAGVLVLLVAILFVLFMNLGLPTNVAGYYPAIIEGSCLLIYFLILKGLKHAKS